MRDPATVAGMLCPVCKVGLAMSDRQGVEIDYCPQCRGVWLDRGELDKIIERNSTEAAPTPPPPPRHVDQGYREDRRGPWGGDHNHYKKRKRSFLEDLFD